MERPRWDDHQVKKDLRAWANGPGGVTTKKKGARSRTRWRGQPAAQRATPATRPIGLGPSCFRAGLVVIGVDP